MKCALMLAASLILAPVSAAAGEVAEPDFISVEDLPEGEARAQIDWRIDASGAVRLVRNACPQCAGLRLNRYEFTVDPAHYRRIAGLLETDVVHNALNSPCSLPHATYGWIRPVNLVIRSGNLERHTGFVRECKSPELDRLRKRLANATAILLELIRTENFVEKREY